MTGTERVGGCQCGAVRFSAEGPPKFVCNCHCADCRRATGAPFSTFVGFLDDQIAWSGETRAFRESSPGVTRSFCSTCGSPLSYQGAKWAGETHLYIGNFDNPGDLTPTSDVFVEEALPWAPIRDRKSLMTAFDEKTAVVTGASTGIGRAISKKLVDKGWRVFGSVRKETDADSLREELGERFTALTFDVTEPGVIQEAANEVREALEGHTLNGLVNNAGVAVGGPLLYIDPDEMRRQFEINVLGPLHVTQAFGPLLGVDRSLRGAPGRIVNMSSVGGKLASPILGPYAMSKHALEAFTRSLRRELLMHGVDVIAVGPGAVKTPIWKKADDVDADIYKDTEYHEILLGMRKMFKEANEQGLPAEAIGKLVHKILTVRKPKPRYAVLKNKFLFYTLPRLMPERMLDKVMADKIGISIRKLS